MCGKIRTMKVKIIDKSYRALEEQAVEKCVSHVKGLGAVECGLPNKAMLARALQARGQEGRKVLGTFEFWLLKDFGYKASTAKRKRRMVWGCLCDYPEAPWRKVLEGHDGGRCLGVRSWTYQEEIRRALRDFCAWILGDPDVDKDERGKAENTLRNLGYDVDEIINWARLRRAAAKENRKD